MSFPRVPFPPALKLRLWKARSSPDWCSGAWWAALPPVALVQPWGLPPTEAVRAIALALEGLNASWTPPLRVAAVAPAAPPAVVAVVVAVEVAKSKSSSSESSELRRWGATAEALGVKACDRERASQLGRRSPGCDRLSWSGIARRGVLLLFLGI